MLTVNEAATYFNLGTNKIRNIAKEYIDSGIAVYNGNHILIKRNKFEKFLEEIESI